MSKLNPTEDEYYRFIVASLEEDDNPLMDWVATPAEWMTARAALERWMAEKDADYVDLIDHPDQ